MQDVLAAVGLLLLLEGALYALAPAAMRRLMRAMLELPEATLKRAGLAAAVAGTALVWVARRLF